MEHAKEKAEQVKGKAQEHLHKEPRVTDHLLSLFESKDSVSTLCAQDPALAPGDASSKVFGHKGLGVTASPSPHEYDEKTKKDFYTPPTEADVERALRCGRWGDQKPSALFAKAWHDAILPLEKDPMIGCVSPSAMSGLGVLPLSIVAPLPDIIRHMANLIARAEKEVFLATNYWMDSDASRLVTDALRELSRRAGERKEKVIVKLMYDRGNVKQVFDNHQPIDAKEYTGESVRLPGPDEISNISLEVQNYHRPVFGTFHSKFMVVDRKIGVISSNNIQDNDNLEMMAHVEGPIVDSMYDLSLVSWHNKMEPALPGLKHPAADGGLPTFGQESFTGLFDEQGHLRVPEAGAARSLAQVTEDGNKNNRLPENLPGDPHYDPDIAAEVTRMQSVMTPVENEKRIDVINRKLNQAKHDNRKATAPDPEPGREMTPYVPHSAHTLFPMALVNRKPYGSPNHDCVWTPQNEAWLALVRNATQTIFIQTPDLNDKPLLPALLAAVRRGVTVTYYVCLGYNDAGELLPFQGGHNEAVAAGLYEALADDAAARARLHVHYYVGADQTRPVHNQFKSRSCHIKLLIADDAVAVIGNGNQDTQSWFHSQEANLLLDSAEICKTWEEAIDRNQNTRVYGKAGQEDGIWRDDDGKEAEGAIGKDPGRFSWAKGVVGAVQRVRGAGGF